jgi:hypothetical protein
MNCKSLASNGWNGCEEAAFHTASSCSSGARDMRSDESDLVAGLINCPLKERV